MTLYEQTKAFVKKVTDDALNLAKEKGELSFDAIPEYAVEEPREKEFGDFSVNAAMVMAKVARRAPRDIANIIVSNMCNEGTYINEVNVAGAGFINFKLNPVYITKIKRPFRPERFWWRQEGQC